MIQHYLCRVEFKRSDTDEILSIGSCDVWARGINDARDQAALDHRSQFDRLTAVHTGLSKELVEREITVEEEIIPGPDEVMFLAGYDSGDMECWCYDVTAWDFERVTGNPPNVDWNRESIIQGLPEPHWQLSMDDILKWAGGRPIRLEAKKIPEVKDPSTPTTYTGEQMDRRCMTSVYLCTGVLSHIEELDVESIESPGGSEFIGAVCFLAQGIDDWLEANQIDVEELTDGYYLYEVVEEELSEKIVLHAKDNDGDLPSREEVIAMLQDIRTRHQKETE